MTKDSFLLDPEVTYINCANMSAMLKSVHEAALKGNQTRATPWKLTNKEWFADAEVLRELVARVFQTSWDNVGFVPSASYGLAMAAKNIKLKGGKSIIVLDRQFPSNVYVWEKLANEQNLKLIRIKKHQDRSLTDCILDHINEETGLVAVPNCHWMDGSLVDLGKISDRVKQVGALLILDLSQSLGALPINIERIDPDYAVSVGYKWMLGPYGLGYQYIAPRWQSLWEPLEYTWLTRARSDDFSTLTQYTNEFRNGARKFDMGEYPQFNTLPMAIAALQEILDHGIENIQLYTQRLTTLIAQYNRDVYGFVNETAGHITAVPIKNQERLKGILTVQKVVISYREALIRISPHIYNTTQDIERLINCLKQ